MSVLTECVTKVPSCAKKHSLTQQQAKNKYFGLFLVYLYFKEKNKGIFSFFHFYFYFFGRREVSCFGYVLFLVNINKNATTYFVMALEIYRLKLLRLGSTKMKNESCGSKSHISNSVPVFGAFKFLSYT